MRWREWWEEGARRSRASCKNLHHTCCTATGFISDRLLKVTLELRGRAKAVTFVVAYAPTETQNANKKHAFWTSLDRVVEEVPKHEQLFVLMDANACTGRREKRQVGSKDGKILGAYGRDTLNDNGEQLLSSLTTMT